MPEPEPTEPGSIQHRPWWITALGGLAVTASSLGAAALAAAVIGVRSPVVAVGGRVIDAAPRGVKEWAISNLGTADKPALQVGTVVLLLAASIGIVALGFRRIEWGMLGIAAFALLGVVAVDRSIDGTGGYIPPIIGGLAGAIALWILCRTDPESMIVGGPVDRRRFLLSAAAVCAAAITSGAIGAAISRSRAGQLAATALKLRLPKPTGAAAAPTVPASASAGRGVSSFITPNDSFYRIDTALLTPSVDVDTWRLSIGGMVDDELELSFDDLLGRDLVERVITLCCVSNEVGGEYVGNATWLGVPLADLLDEAGVQDGADQVASRSVDGWTCGFPTSVALDGRDAIVAVGMNGDPLPQAHGFPARLVVPGLYGYVSATKWLEEITLTTLDGFDGYWIPRGWSKLGPVKTQSRIDVPRSGSSVSAGTVAVAGVAWAQHRGIERVEVQVDGGEWQDARLATALTPDTWRQWVYEWKTTPGAHRLAVRATDGSGSTQTGKRAEPAPNGATGWHTIDVDVAG